MQRVTLKTSTIFIAKAGRTRVYRSLGEIPVGLRKELEDSTNGFNSATILIADRRGREEIRRALGGLPAPLRTRLTPALDSPPSAPPSAPRAHGFGRQRLPWMLLAAALLAGAIAVWR
jgi:hypothetical protein